MHSALLFVDTPDTAELEGEQLWLRAKRSVEDAIKRHPTVETLAENCWLIPLDNGASALAAFVTAANNHRLGHRILFFEKAPDWVKSSKDAC